MNIGGYETKFGGYLAKNRPSRPFLMIWQKSSSKLRLVNLSLSVLYIRYWCMALYNLDTIPNIGHMRTEPITL